MGNTLSAFGLDIVKRIQASTEVFCREACRHGDLSDACARSAGRVGGILLATNEIVWDDIRCKVDGGRLFRLIERFGEAVDGLKTTFGAPGDFGYSTPLGAAMADLYRLRHVIHAEIHEQSVAHAPVSSEARH